MAAGAALLVVAACAPASTAAPARSPTASPTPLPSPIPTPTQTPPAQRVEASLPMPVEEAGAAAAGGNLYVIGGFNAAGASLASVFVFDGATWSTGPSLPLAVDHPSAASLDGHVYLAGGHSNGRDSGRLFRLDGDRWAELATMHYPRGGHALVATAGRLFAIGGNNSHGNVGPAEAYDPGTNAWTVLAAVPVARNHVSGFNAGSAACVAGGRSPTTGRVDCLDTGSGAWSRLPDLPQPTSGGGAASFVSGDVVVAGGQDASETQIVGQVDFYSAGAWTASQDMLAPRHGFELAMFDGRAWACGGGTAPGLHPAATCTSLGDAPSPNS